MPHIITPTKNCTKCKEKKPATAEYFSRDRSKPDGLRPDCKVCMSTRSRSYYRKNADSLKEKRNIQRRPIEVREKNAARQRVYRSMNREKDAVYQRAYRSINHERIKERDRTRKRIWQAKNPEIVRALSHKYRARKYAAAGNHDTEDVRRRYVAQKGKCYWCNTKVGDIYHVDHIIPLSRGGSNGTENIVIACPNCNLSKGDKLPVEWDGNRNGRLL